MDKLVVDLADFTMPEERHTTQISTCVPNEIPHNSAIFDMLIWKDENGTVHADLVTPKTHGKYMPPQLILQSLVEYCLQRATSSDVEVIQISCVTEL